VRKRRTRYQWFYNVGSIGPEADVEDTTAGRDLFLTVNANGTSNIGIQECILDTSSDESVATNQPLIVTAGNDYFIKRIVGKLFVGVDQISSTGNNAILIAAGIFVARAGDADDAAGAQDLPIGAQGIGGTDNYSAIRAENIREPWMWRRTWILSNQLSTTITGQRFPRSNAECGSIQDGPHVDAKTSRRVRDGERLFWTASVRNWPLNTLATQETTVRFHFDYRVLGSLRKKHNRSVF